MYMSQIRYVPPAYGQDPSAVPLSEVMRKCRKAHTHTLISPSYIIAARGNQSGDGSDNRTVP